ncbi:probable cation-transporting ATPase 13A3 isoform X2 [Zootermopsis nevadensis]|uniref:probable cation-transporting ATPase 13A3 isoform X2 n=1 Tax=Zootermopsis nevadensis TaxID=136037 RepID=UPI000B8E480A|nr:probable cation-transporting ATPase 13A3 isoform X2 [Zootermopsis nevadensis]
MSFRGRKVFNLVGFSHHRGYAVIGEENSQEIESEERLTCYGFRTSYCKQFVFHAFAVLFAGIPYMLLHWYCQYAAYIKYSKCSLEEAHILLIQDFNGHYSIQQIFISVCSWPGSGQVRQIRYFHHHLLKFVWDDGIKAFTRLHGLDDGMTTLSQLHVSHGLSANEQEQMIQLHGENMIIINVKSYWRLFIEEVFNPFYIFQVFSVILWSLDEYLYYACCIVFLTTASVVTSLFQTRKQSEGLRDLVAASNSAAVTVCRKGSAYEDIPASCLVPGDVIMIPPQGCFMACDAVLLTGNCIVNESILTGESMPVTKTPPPHSDEYYDPVSHKRHTLFSGTHIIQTRIFGDNKVMAVVVRTGFSTVKGELVRSILFPKPMSGFKFYQDSIRFILFLFLIAALGMAYCIHLYVKRHASIETILLRTLDIMTIVVPPALPAAMTAGTVYSQSRLKKLGIFCISPPRINVCGKVKLVCFDKTGTLTEEGLNLWSMLPSQNSKFCDEPVRDPAVLPVESPFIATMATCHSLTVVDGKLTGDPLDIMMFEATQWVLEKPGQDTSRYDTLCSAVVKPRPRMHRDHLPYEICLVHQFPFSSAKQCMSVIARKFGSPHMTLYTKGAPEKIKTLSKKETVPGNFDSLLMEYTLTGYRVIALAYKNLSPKFNWKQAQRTDRDQLENGLEFLGLLIMQNALKPETSPIIAQLQVAQIRCVMVTGDNILTAVSVARDCGMVPPSEQVIQVTVEGDLQLGRIHWEVVGVPQSLHHGSLRSHSDCVLPLIPSTNSHIAVDGATWTALKNYHPELLPQIVIRSTIFARMAPDQKAQVVEVLKSLDYVVAMCGDGANDCGALKAAHIGISLSEAEASVAAPFTSRVANITCVLKLIQEGRCALVTSFGVFKYMALYSLIQFVTVLLLYKCASILGNMQFLYIDLGITTSIAILMGHTGPATRLVSERPIGSLVSASNIIPLILQVLLMVAVQIATLCFVMKQPWFDPIKQEEAKEGIVVCWENTSLFCISSFQYLILAAVYSRGKAHRKPFYTNLLFLFTLVLFTTFTTLLLIYPVGPVAEFFELMPMSKNNHHVIFRLWLLAFPSVHLLASVFIEACVADTKWLKRFLHCLSRKSGPKNKYKRIDRDLSAIPGSLK